MMIANPDDKKENKSFLKSNFSPSYKISIFNMMRYEVYWLGISKREEENIRISADINPWMLLETKLNGNKCLI